jgi:DNA-directed RNA polymerase specialized sigma24 family protein
VTPRHLALLHAEQRLIARLEKLEPRLEEGDPACWQEYAAIASALAAISPQLEPHVIADVLTQRELAERLDVSPRTIRRRIKRGELPRKRSRS